MKKPSYVSLWSSTRRLCFPQTWANALLKLSVCVTVKPFFFFCSKLCINIFSFILLVLKGCLVDGPMLLSDLNFTLIWDILGPLMTKFNKLNHFKVLNKYWVCFLLLLFTFTPIYFCILMWKLDCNNWTHKNDFTWETNDIVSPFSTTLYANAFHINALFRF